MSSQTLTFNKTILLGLIVLLTVQANAGENETLNLLPANTTALCVSEQSTGFDWNDRKWVHKKFKGGDKYLAKKISFEKYDTPEKKQSNDLHLCEEPRVRGSTKSEQFFGFVEACYEIKEMGRKSDILSRAMCDEMWVDGKLKKISCERHTPHFYFLPEGAFIVYPWHSDIDQTKNSKDSLSIDVGICSKID